MTARAHERNRLNFSWLIKLRFSSVAGQIATILGVYLLFDIALPLVPLFAIVGIEFASTVACALWFRESPAVREIHLAAVMALDVFLLTLLLYFTGGPFNPFCFLYLVNISLAAVVLKAQWTWALVALSLASFGMLFFDFQELPIKHLEPGDHASVLQQGTWVAFGVAAAFIVHFLWRVTRALADQEHALEDVRLRAERQERLASLATMAAGAAHELATPLGTIAVVSNELQRTLSAHDVEAAVDDLRLIREQVARCRLILDKMGAGAGMSGDLSVETVTLGELFAETLTGIREAPEVNLQLEGLTTAQVRLPTHAVAQALRSLITNAQDASSSGSRVDVRVTSADGAIQVDVEDRGVGMSADVVDRACEPFFTTKEPGRGMGLGLFLSQAIVEKLGGSFRIDSVPGQGTTARIVLPTSSS